MASVPLVPVTVLLTLYAAASVLAPPIVSAALAALALLHAFYAMLLGNRPPPAFYGLVALSLPVLPSLQFVLGYPMRVVSAALTVAALKVQGLAVEREGTHLLWAGERIQFDAPCSGVNMLWAGLMLTLMACTVWRSGVWMTVMALAAALVLTILANVLRAVSLFYFEAGLVAGALPWWHEAIGLAAFMGAAGMILIVLNRLRAWEVSAWAR
jgi:exosortase/archaeosortase family protein